MWVRNPAGGMDVCCDCCVLSGRGLCDELITHPEESYRPWYVVVCDLETSRMMRPWPALGRSATRKQIYSTQIFYSMPQNTDKVSSNKNKIRDSSDKSCNLKIFSLTSFMSFQWHLQKNTLRAVGWGKYYDAEETDRDLRGEFRGQVLQWHSASRSVGLKVTRRNSTSFWSLAEARTNSLLTQAESDRFWTDSTPLDVWGKNVLDFHINMRYCFTLLWRNCNSSFYLLKVTTWHEGVNERKH